MAAPAHNATGDAAPGQIVNPLPLSFAKYQGDVPYTGSVYKPVNVAHVTAQEKTLVASINEYKESEAYRLGYEQGKLDMYAEWVKMRTT